MPRTNTEFKHEEIVQYQHPTKGGWYIGRFVKAGTKRHTIRVVRPAVVAGKLTQEPKLIRVPVDDVKALN